MARARQLATLLLGFMGVVLALIGGFVIVGPFLAGTGSATPGDSADLTTQALSTTRSPTSPPLRSPTASVAELAAIETAVPMHSPVPSATGTPSPAQSPEPSATNTPSPTPSAVASATPRLTPTSLVTVAPTRVVVSPEAGPASATSTPTAQEPAGFSVKPASLAVAEPQGAGTLTISLTRPPLAPVTVFVYPSSDQCQVSPAELTLDGDNWQVGLTVRVEAVDDLVADGDQTCGVEFGAATSDAADYDGITPDPVSVTVHDDDIAGIDVWPAALELTEPDGSETFAVSLNTEPLAPVTIPLSASNDQCRATPAEVTLDGQNWREGMAVRVEAVDDLIADGEQPCEISFGAATSSAADYSGMVPENALVTVQDDDVAAIIVTPSTVTVDESGGKASVTISLNSEPVAPVSFSPSATNTQCRVSAADLALDSQNWQEGLSVQVEAVDDLTADGDQICEVRFGAARSSGPDYSGMTPDKVYVTVTDDDVAGINIWPTTLELSEPTGAESLTISLNSQPLAPVAISLNTSNDQCRAMPSELKLDSDSWKEGVTVQVLAVNDLIADGEQSCQVTFGAAASEGEDYDGLSVEAVTVSVLDDDVAGIDVGPTSLTVVESGDTTFFTVALTSQPRAPVTITLSPSNDECRLSHSQLVLDSDNWRDAARVRVDAVDDRIADGDQLCTVEFAPTTSADTAYEGLVAETVAVTTMDNDRAGINISPLALMLAEPGGAGTFGVSLNSEPLAPVRLPFSTSSAECTVSPVEVTLDSRNWRNGATLRVEVVDDNLVDYERTCIVEAGPTVSTADDYDDLIPGSVTVTIQDDDVAGILVAPASLALAEPKGSGTFTVALSSEPFAPVVVSLTAEGQVDASPAELTFTHRKWRVPQSVTVTTKDDRVAEGQHSGILRLSPSSPDPEYNALAVISVTVQITDDDVAGVVITPTLLQLTEGEESQGYQVALTSRPTHPAVLSITGDPQVSISPSPLTFTLRNWDVAQSVAVTAVDDQVAEAEHTSLIRHILVSEDGVYAGLTISDVKANIIDNDPPSGVVTSTGVVTASGALRTGETLGSTLQRTFSNLRLDKIRVSPPIIIVVALAILAALAELTYGRRRR